MSNPFDYVTSASFTKKNLMRDTENDDLAEKGYNPWLTNIAFSYHPDSILHANLMNKYHYLDKRPQYEFYINSLRSKKRFAKWSKSIVDEDLDFVCEYYECNRNVAKQYLSLLTSDEIKLMKQEQETGGMKNERGR